MPINNTSRTAGPYVGNGVTKVFPFAYKVFTRQDVLVAVTDAGGTETLLTLDADYTVTLNADQDLNPGGVITTTAAPAAGTTLAATSNIPITQGLDLTNNGGFYPKAISNALDKLTITVQQVAARVGLGLNVGAAAQLERILEFIGVLAAQGGAALVGFLQGGNGAVQRLVQDKLRESFVTLEDFGAGRAGVTDAQAWALAAGHCLTTKKAILLTRVYDIKANITLPTDTAVRGVSRLNAGLLFYGAASLNLAGAAGAKNAGNLTLSSMLLSHATSGTALNMSEFKDVIFDDVEFYHAGIAATKFSYLTFRNCIGFDFSVRLFNEINQLNEAPKFLGGRYSDLQLNISETTDIVLSDLHNLGPKAQILIDRGANPPGLYPFAFLSNVVVDSSDNECIKITGCSVKMTNVFASGGRTNLKPGIYLIDCKESSVANTTARYCGTNGMQLYACKGMNISGSTFADNKQYGVQLDSCSYVKILGNQIGNTPDWYGGSYPQQIGIVDAPANSTYIYVDGNAFQGNTAAPVYMPNVTNDFGTNTGLVRATRGTAAVTTVGGAATIPHGLGGIPKHADAQALSSGDQKTQITNVDATNIYLRISTATTNASLDGSFTVFWSAEL